MSTWQVVICLWLLSVIGSVFSFFTLAYIGMLSICDVSRWNHPFSLIDSKFSNISFLDVSLDARLSFHCFIFCLVFGGLCWRSFISSSMQCTVILRCMCFWTFLPSYHCTHIHWMFCVLKSHFDSQLYWTSHVCF